MGLGEFITGVGNVIQTGIETLPAIIAAGQGGAVVPGGTPQVVQPLLPGLTTPGTVGATVAGVAGACPSFRASPTRVSPIRELRAVDPTTGKIHSWQHAGTPLIWSRDRACAKRYAKQAGFTLKRRGSGGKATRRGRK